MTVETQMRAAGIDSKTSSGAVSTDLEQLACDISSAVVDYSKKQPGAVACAIFVVGFFVGWKIKPW